MIKEKIQDYKWKQNVTFSNVEIFFKRGDCKKARGTGSEYIPFKVTVVIKAFDINNF